MDGMERGSFCPFFVLPSSLTFTAPHAQKVAKDEVLIVAKPNKTAIILKLDAFKDAVRCGLITREGEGKGRGPPSDGCDACMQLSTSPLARATRACSPQPRLCLPLSCSHLFPGRRPDQRDHPQEGPKAHAHCHHWLSGDEAHGARVYTKTRQ